MRSLVDQTRFALAVDTTESVARDPAHASEPIEDPDEDTLSVPALLSVLIERDGSDLHLMAGSPPIIRVCGELERLDRFPPLLPEAVRAMVYAILPAKMRERFEQELELDMSYALPGKARFRVNVYQQRDVVGAAFRLIPCEIKTAEELGLPPVVGDLARYPRGFRHRDRSHRLGEVHHARRDGRRGERRAGGACDDHRGSDRVPAQEQAGGREPA